MRVKVIGKTEEVQYPCIMRSKQGKIVLFSRAGVGTVLAYKGTTEGMGYHDTAWDMAAYEPWHGFITIEQD